MDLDPEQSLSDLQTKQRTEALLRDGWKVTPATFAHRLTGGEWIPARHLLYLSTIVATEVAKGGARIIIMAPPRHGKSQFMSVHLPSWFLENWPSKHVITATYAADLATDFAVAVRDVFLNKDNQALLNTRLRQDKKGVARFLTTKGGSGTAVGIGGPITGRGADLLLIDDYYKNNEESLSETMRDKIWEWFRSTAYTRLEPGGSLAILATRWHIDDLIGRCLDQMSHEDWKVIRLPAMAEDVDVLGRKPGEVLWPERYPHNEITNIRQALGSYWFDAMYQQQPRPSMSELAIGDMIRTVAEEEIPSVGAARWVRAWDLSSGEINSDWSVGLLMCRARGDGKCYIKDIRRFRKSPYGNEQMVAACALGDGVNTAVVMEQEPGSSGETVIQHFSRDILYNYGFEGIRPTGPKEIRAQPFLAACEAGNVRMLEADWNNALRQEVNAFPDGEFDDQVDSAAMAYNKLFGEQGHGLTWGRGPIGAAYARFTQRRRRQEQEEERVHRPSSTKRMHQRRRGGISW